MNAGTRPAVRRDGERPASIRRARPGLASALTPNGVGLRPGHSRNTFTRELNRLLQRCHDRRSFCLDAHNVEGVFSRASTVGKSAKWLWCIMMGHIGSAFPEGSANGAAKHPRWHSRSGDARLGRSVGSQRAEQAGAAGTEDRRGGWSVVHRGQGHMAGGVRAFCPGESLRRGLARYWFWTDSTCDGERERYEQPA